MADRTRAANTHWQLWVDFCTSLAVHPLLADIADPIALQQVFLHRYRTGAIAPSGRQVRSRTVEDALRSVAQTFAALGAKDPRKDAHGAIDFRIQRQLRSYAKADPPPHRVKPLPPRVFEAVLVTAIADANVANLAIADMIAIAFFFLLRPGEYTATASDTTPFRLCDVQLSIGGLHIHIPTADDATLSTATFATLTFTNQKNGVRGEVIGLGRSGNAALCPVTSIIRRVLHLRAHGAAPTAPLSTYYNGTRWLPVRPANITDTLRLALLALGPDTIGCLPSDVSARSLRASGAMALLCAQVDSDIIRLLGRWRSDEMLRYLHVQAEPVMRHFAQHMVTRGDFVLHPNPPVAP